MPAGMLRQFVQVLLMGEALSLKSTLAKDAYVDDPTVGRIGVDHLSRLGAQWRDRGAARDPKWIATTVSPQRVIGEFEISVHGPDGVVPLPVAAVAEPGEDGLLLAVRLYHGFWPLEAAHRVRGRIVECHSSSLHVLNREDPVARYQAALATGDLEGVLATFADGAYAREPSGGRSTYRGLEGLRSFYSALFSNPGGIPLQHCTVTDDGTRCAIEYTVDRWGGTPLPIQSGVAVYERSGDHLAAARIYDDVDPPLSPSYEV